jgi:hypothetical protein
MTYRELMTRIQQMTEDQKDSDLTIFVSDIDEFYPAELRFTDESEDRLDPSHPFIADKAPE